MKQTCVFRLSVLMVLISISCGYVSAQAPEPLLEDGLSWVRLFYKNDLEHYKREDFSSDGERFLTSDKYKFIRLWKKPFKSPARELLIDDYGAVASMQFFGDQHDIFITDDDGLAQIWDKDLQIKKFEYRFPDNVQIASITADGRFIAADGWLYDRRKKSLVDRGYGHAAYRAVKFGGSSLLLTAGSYDQSIAVRNIYGGKYEKRMIPHPITSAGISPNEKFAVAVTKKGRCYLWHWPDQEPKVLTIPRGKIYFLGFSPDSKWFVIYGPESEFFHIYGTDPSTRIARFEPDQPFTSVHAASNNLILMGDGQGYVHIYDVSAGRMIARQKVCERPVEPLKFVADKGYLWVGSSHYNTELRKRENGEVALYQIKGLEPYLEPHGADKSK